MLQTLFNHSLYRVKLDNNSYHKINNLFSRDIVFIPRSSKEYLYFGFYHFCHDNIGTAILNYLKAIKKGCSQANIWLGYLYFECNNPLCIVYLQKVPNDKTSLYYMWKFTKDQNYLVQSANKGHRDALCDYAKVDLENKFPLWERAAKQNYSRAMYCLGVEYKSLKDYVKAEHWYKKAVDLGHPAAMNNLGSLYRLQKKYDLAEKYYGLALENNHMYAEFNMGHLYWEQKMFTESEPFLLRALAKGDKDTINMLIDIYKTESRHLDLIKLLHKNALYDFQLSKITSLIRPQAIEYYQNNIDTLDKATYKLLMELYFDTENYERCVMMAIKKLEECSYMIEKCLSRNFQEILKFLPMENPKISSIISNYYFNTKQYQEAILMMKPETINAEMPYDDRERILKCLNNLAYPLIHPKADYILSIILKFPFYDKDHIKGRLVKNILSSKKDEIRLLALIANRLKK